MESQVEDGSAEMVMSSFQLADRAARNYVHMRQWEGFEKSLANPWTLECPEGVQVKPVVKHLAFVLTNTAST